jgi:histidinol-phosphate aminotransferase
MQPRVSRVIQTLPEMVPFVAPEALEAQLGIQFRLRMGANESSFGPSPRALQAMRDAIEGSAHYGDPQSVRLREALAERERIEVDEVAVASGIDDLLILLCRAYLDPGDFVVTSLGSYPTFEFAAQAAGACVERVPYREAKPDLLALATAAKRRDARVVYLANPDNPSGAFHSREGLEEFRAALPPETLLLLDEAYVDFVPVSELADFGPGDAGVVRLRTFSKAHGLAGLRIGYALGHACHRRALDKVRPHFGVNSVAQAAALASLGDREHLSSVVAATGFGRMELMDIARRAGLYARASRTNFVLLDGGNAERAAMLLQRLLQAGVFVRKPAQPPLDRYIRVTVGTPDDHAEFGTILAPIVATLPSP